MISFQVTGDLFNRIFEQQTAHPGLTVDYNSWMAILEALPESYSLPDREIIPLIASLPL